jgi:CTP:molybdopterin cytidylyltransferase MocA
MLFALIPAGGQSTRMSRPKLALPLGGRSVLEHVIAALRQAGVPNVLVVLGPHVAELRFLAEHAGADVHLLPEVTADMRATIEAGLRCLEERCRPGPDDDWLLIPADHPLLDPVIVQQLLRARQAHPEKEIILPVFQGRRGHPALIRWRQVAGLRQHPPHQGLNTYLRQHSAETLEVPVESANILLDLDTPEDYQRLLKDPWFRGA